MSKSSEMTESTRKRARKRAREGEEEEKEKPESIANFITQKTRGSTFSWTRKEDELLLTLVSQFGPSWNLICNVFVLENWQRLHPLKQFPENWRFLADRKKMVDAAIPIQVRYTCIPQKTLSTTQNPFFAYCYPYLKDAPARIDDEDDDEDDLFDNCLENAPETASMEEEAKQSVDSVSPIDAIFAAVESKQVSSALFKPSTLDETQMADLKKRDSQFAKYETDRLKRLQRYLRPETPASSTKELARRAPASFRNPSSLASDPSSLNSLQNADKTMRNRVPVRSFPMQRPADIKKLRENAIRMLPIAQILIKTDSSKFQHLLDSHRRPQDGIVVPYEQALEQGQRILEESTKQHNQLIEMERKLESDIQVKVEPESASLAHSKSQATEVMEGLRDLFDSLPSFSREAQESARNHSTTPTHELDDSSPVISFDLNNRGNSSVTDQSSSARAGFLDRHGGHDAVRARSVPRTPRNALETPEEDAGNPVQPPIPVHSAGDGAGEQIGEATGGESGVGRVGESEAAEDSAKQFRANSPLEAVDRAVSVLSDGLPAYMQ